MPTALCNGRIMVPAGLRDDVCVVIDGTDIRTVSSGPPPDAEIVDLGGKLLLPGFVDVQVNGGGGRLFNDDPSVETIAAIAAAHRRFGTTGLLPTLISDDLNVVEKGIAAVDAAIAAGVPGILGIHVEGPFLSPARHGIHLTSKLRRLEDDFIAVLGGAKHGRTLVTIAPEIVRPDQVARLTAAGVIVSAGHSDAGYDQVRAAIDSGVTGFTHLFNAMSQLRNRAPGMVGAALEDESVYCGVIVDGHHIHPASLRVALRAKGPEHMMLVTDAMPSVGCENGDFLLQGRAITRSDDRLLDAEGTLAGSTLSMARAVANVIDMGRVTLHQASRMASTTPAEFLGLGDRLGAIVAGLRADLVALNDDYTVAQSWIGGVPDRD
ncbi:N-acetylglucosamine-6-phosphate deacetylase [Stakelama sp. CBK3Z-3]|uniref:N-acetylglucosamine-6-phosphate deacetylase n=1 Tax=Stakelama flava TaxID=2860338 RepID=A0ABS6XK97_9SPHN|nr:N-acetylglucosamine-6-phosphate deacetylase [Stakelama flava]MBW4330238.1 N-acetylglucosamine-6-phosphate deacetylase [Stakelama flava]